MQTRFLAGIFLATFLSGAAAHAQSPNMWLVLDDKSHIGFVAHYGGESISGRFPKYTASIAFDPKRLAQSKAIIKIDISGVQSTDKEAQQNLPLPDWFDALKYPVAVFETTSFRHLEGKRYEANGTLTLRNKSIPITLPFALDIFPGDGADAHKNFARMSATLTLKRLDFGIGQGQWSDTSAVKNEVDVQIKLEAVNP